jgi:hypothetical protein
LRTSTFLFPSAPTLLRDDTLLRNYILASAYQENRLTRCISQILSLTSYQQYRTVRLPTLHPRTGHPHHLHSRFSPLQKRRRTTSCPRNRCIWSLPTQPTQSASTDYPATQDRVEEDGANLGWFLLRRPRCNPTRCRIRSPRHRDMLSG